MSNRTPGVIVHLLDRDLLSAACGGRVPADSFMHTGIIHSKNDGYRTINTEGVSDKRDDHGKIAVYVNYGGWIDFSYSEIADCVSGETIDLSSFVRTFGDRLESNFALAYRWATTDSEDA